MPVFRQIRPMLPKRLFCWIGRLPRVGISRGTIDTMSHIGQKGRGQPGGHGGRGRGLPSDPTRMYMNHEYNLRNGQSGYAANMVAGGQSRHWIQSSNGQWHQQGMATPGTFSNGSNMPNVYQERLQQQDCQLTRVPLPSLGELITRGKGGASSETNSHK